MNSNAPFPLRLLIIMGVSSFFYVVLCLHLPVALYADGLYDDALFTTHAASIYSGHWLGPYDLRTLVKGPGFPLFLALNEVLGLPITLTLALFYSVACIFFAWSLYRLTGGVWLTLALFLVIQWHPCVFPMRITRDDISPAQVLLVLGCVIQFAFVPTTLWRRMLWAVSGGLFFGWYWMTREDVIWIVPGLAFMLATQLILMWRRRETVRELTAGIGLFLLVAFGLHVVVAMVNLVDYGTFETEDMKAPAFARVVKDLQSVRVGAPVPYVPVPAKVRQAIDTVSPAFAALEPYFKGPGKGWTLQTCGFDPVSCGDLAGGWFVFALRDAVAWKDEYHTPAQAAAYFTLIAQQVEAACRSGRLTCQPGLTALMPAVTRSQWAAASHIIGQIYNMLALRDPLELADDSTGNAESLQTMAAILNRPLRTSSRDERMSAVLDGWFIPKTDDWLQLRCTTAGHDEIIPIPRLPSPDLVTFFKNSALTFDRFNIAIPSESGCDLQIANGTGDGPLLDLARARPGPVFMPVGELYFGSITALNAPAAGAHAQHVLLALTRLYRVIFPIVGLAAVLSYLWSLVRLVRGRRIYNLVILASGLWILLLSRCGILLLVDISAFPAISQVYMLPAFMVSFMAFTVSIALSFQK